MNANAGAVTDAQIDDALARWATLAISVPAGDEVELDCLGLAYCAAGGTGTTLVGSKPFPGDFDADGDGFGTITRGATGDFQLHPGATSAEIGSGDSFIHRVTSGGVETTAAGTLNYVFSTTPALTTFTTAAGSGTISYPVAPGGLGPARIRSPSLPARRSAWPSGAHSARRSQAPVRAAGSSTSGT